MQGTMTLRRFPWGLVRLPFACLPLLLGACGEEQPPAPAAMMPALKPGEVELGTGDIPPPRSMVAATPAGSREAETELSLASDPRKGAYQEFQDAFDRLLRAGCECRFAELGHPSADTCFERLRQPDFAKFCTLSAFSRNALDLGPRYACLAQTRNASASCVEERGCGAFDECEATREQARRDCFVNLSYADVEFADLDVSCQRLTRLGPPSGCPDATVSGALLGSQVFEGDTTGAGDDVTLSCRPSFDEFGSPDLVVQWQAPAAGLYAFSTERSAFTTQIGILDGCGGRELACGSSSGTSFGEATVWVALEAQQTVAVVLEGYEVIESGYVRLNVNAVPE
jgi:hypothetical protein